MPLDLLVMELLSKRGFVRLTGVWRAKSLYNSIRQQFTVIHWIGVPPVISEVRALSSGETP